VKEREKKKGIVYGIIYYLLVIIIRGRGQKVFVCIETVEKREKRRRKKKL
jgi:hypothetical protein